MAFCGQISFTKIKRIQESALRFMLNDQINTYNSLLDKCNYITLHNMICIKAIVVKP